MKPTRLFLDTAFVQALLNKNDQYHRIAKSRLNDLRTAKEVWTTEAILIEIGNALSVPVDTGLLNRVLGLYDERADKERGLTDGISVAVMSDQSLADAKTTDRHFIQAGFCTLMRDSESE